jgi:hypothetical protein
MKASTKTWEELKHDWELQKERVKTVLEDEDAWIHVAYIYISTQTKKMNFKINKNGTIDRRENIGRLVAKLYEATSGRLLEFIKDSNGNWIRKEGS